MVPLGGSVAGLVVDGDEIAGATVAAAVDGREEGAPPGVLQAQTTRAMAPMMNGVRRMEAGRRRSVDLDSSDMTGRSLCEADDIGFI